MKELDVRGLSCPEPVLILLASEAHVVKNITHYATSQGKKVSVKEVDLDYEITVE